VVDIGGPIREDLARVNLALSRKGSSYVDQRRGEARFFLALDDMEGCEFQFIWDFRYQGWRTAQTVEATAALRIESDDLTLVAGTFGSAQSVWLIGRTYPRFSYTNPTAVYQTGWLAVPGGKRTPSASVWIPKGLTVTMEERAEGTMDIEGYIDWDDTTAVTTFEDMLTVHPEATVPFWTSTNMGVATAPALYDGTSEVRTLNVTGAATGAGTIVVTLAGTAVNVAISGAMVAGAVASAIAATTFSGWLVQRYGTLVTFVAETVEVKTGTFSFAAGGSGATATGPTQAVAGTAAGDGDVWRKRRTFTTHGGFDTGTTQVLSIKLESRRPLCLLAMDVHGAYVAGPGGRTPQQEY
jgi:hypothetical protein